MILITGCSRAGSVFTQRVLQQLGLRIGHEGMSNGDIGTCSHYATGLMIKYPEVFNQYYFTTIIHQVRHPIKNIESLTTMKYWDHTNRGSNMPFGPSIEYVSPLDVDPTLKEDNLILQCAKYYYLYNTVAAANSEWTFQVEQLLTEDAVFDELCQRLGINDLPGELNIPKENNSRKDVPHRKTVTWELLDSLDPKLTNKLKQLSEQWGYKDE